MSWLRDVLRYPDRRPPPHPGPAARRLARDLEDTARSYPRTVGIAAPQIGVLSLAFVDCTGYCATDPCGWVDPVVVELSGAEIGREGCLSLPDITSGARRLSRCATWTAPRGNWVIRTTGFEARVILHEIDHLDGVLILQPGVLATS